MGYSCVVGVVASAPCEMFLPPISVRPRLASSLYTVRRSTLSLGVVCGFVFELELEFEWFGFVKKRDETVLEKNFSTCTPLSLPYSLLLHSKRKYG